MGITILAVLAAIGGLFGLFGGFVLLGAGAINGMYPILGIITLISAIASLAFAYGAWTLQPWAWMLGLVIQGVNVILAIISLIRGDFSSIVSLIIAGIIIYYLMTPEIKRAFGQSA
jgi:uncharacterized membrane protein (DUF2068 family)